MIYCVLSPVHGQAGVTTASVFLAASIALTQKKRICLTHLDFSNNSIDKMFNIPPTTDLVRSITQIVKLQKSNTITTEDLPMYMTSILPELSYYTSPNVNLSSEEFIDTYKYLIQHLSSFHDIFIDMDANNKTPLYEAALSISERVIIVANSNLNVIPKAVDIRQRIESRSVGKRISTEAVKECFYLINHYNSNVLTYQKLAKHLNVASKELITLSDSFWFPKLTNKGVVDEMYYAALNNDIRVNYLLNDIKRACKILQGADFKWKG